MANTQPRSLPGGAQWAGGYQSPEMVAKRMLAERDAINAKTKLTWNPDKPPNAPLDRVIGEVVLVDKERNLYEVHGVNLSLPYMRVGTAQPGKYYYIQNAKLFKTNGVETSLEEIAQIEANDPIFVKNLMNSFDTFIKDAARRDDALCKVCVQYRAKDHDDYMRHMVAAHADQVLKMVVPDEPALQPVAVAPPIIAPSPATGSPFSCCGKTFKDKRALGAHERFGHKRAK